MSDAPVEETPTCPTTTTGTAPKLIRPKDSQEEPKKNSRKKSKETVGDTTANSTSTNSTSTNQGYKNYMIRLSARAHRPSRARWDFGEVIRILIRRWHHSSSPGMPITFNPRSYKLAFLSVWHLHCHNRTIKMKQGHLNSYFKKFTLVPESSNGDERAGGCCYRSQTSASPAEVACCTTQGLGPDSSIC